MMHNEMMRNIASVLTVLYLCVPIIGCGTSPATEHEQSSVEHEESSDFSDDVDDNSLIEIDDGQLDETEDEVSPEEPLIKGLAGASLDYALEGEGEDPTGWRFCDAGDYFVEHEGLYYPIMSGRFSVTAYSVHGDEDSIKEQSLAFGARDLLSDRGVSPKEYDVVPFPISISSGDKLITTEAADALILTPVDPEVFYYNDNETKSMGSYTVHDEVAGVSLEDIEDHDERDAIVAETLSAQGLWVVEADDLPGVWVSDVPTSVEVGDYRGTEWEVTKRYLDTPFVIKPAGAAVVKLDVTKTHDGYFIVEIGDVTPGTYILSNPSGNMSSFYGGIDYYEGEDNSYLVSIS